MVPGPMDFRGARAVAAAAALGGAEAGRVLCRRLRTASGALGGGMLDELWELWLGWRRALLSLRTRDRERDTEVPSCFSSALLLARLVLLPAADMLRMR